MSGKPLLMIVVASVAVFLFAAALRPVRAAQNSAPAALMGAVGSQEEGAMEGVLVSARKAGSTITITVVSDAQGRYSFPQNRMAPGQYSLSIRAVGYDLDDRGQVEVTPQKTAQADLHLRRFQDLASQLTNAEWLLSMPGDEEQKSYLLGCVNCHTLERIVRSRHNTAEFAQVIDRMTGYYPGASPRLPQRLPAADRTPTNPERFLKPAEFMSTVNLSKVSQWKYPFKTLPRPKGRATHVIITEYGLPREVSQPHDVIVDSEGMAWYSDFGQQYIGKLDPKTGQVTEYPVPELKPGFPRGGLELQQDKEGNIWLGMQFQAGLAKFDKKVRKFQVIPLPKEFDSDRAQVSMVRPEHMDVDRKVWIKDAGSASNIKRLDLASGKFEAINPFPESPGGGYTNARFGAGGHPYGISADSSNNLYFLDLAGDYIGRVDARTLQVKLYRTPTPDSGPRRGHVDSEDRLWFAEYRGNRVAMFDPRTGRFQEFPLPTSWSSPYDAVLDKNGEAWTGGMTNDRIARVDSKRGQIIEYLLPRETNIRRVFVDNSTTPVTFWVGNNHHASVIRLEPLDQKKGSKSQNVRHRSDLSE